MTTAPATQPPEERFFAELAKLSRGQHAELRRTLSDDRPAYGAYFLEGVAYRSGLAWARKEELDGLEQSQRRALYLVAGLYALVERPHDDEPEEERTKTQARKPLSLGALLGDLYRSQDARPSIEKRFLTLLDADREALSYHLRQAVTLLKAANMHPDWPQLLRDVTRWGDAVRQTWARDFYRHAESPEKAVPAASDEDDAAPRTFTPAPGTEEETLE
ncbi:type I-E CRISPR-associated protein Cse2/CasB [Deinococcus sp. YIM 77859]|uniref:type I-E CRISPR-associated protein Cse2/CasB n=1 Tax=Deinococcus sp. YIM 77859 TaxID=1540221 RepID=UPI0006909027|nr:type I-E CRISPR-associated protein Cse2/CasB [Deinococcus sp. YIM 77859]